MQNNNHRPRVCITLPLAYPLFNKSFKGYFGGWEVRISLIARELAKRGRFEVILVVGDYGQPHIECIDGVNMISWRDRDIWGVPPRRNQNSILSWNPFPYHSIPYNIWHRAQNRFFSTLSVYFPGKIFSQIGKYRVPQKNVAIYDEINADIYMVPGNSFFSAEAASYCSKQEKKYVFLSGSDMDYYAEFKENPTGRDIYSVPHFLKMYSIQQADAHIVQTERQAKMLYDSYNRSSTVIKNPIDIDQKFSRNSNPQSILWVGKSDEQVKRPSLVIEFARRMPENQFVVIMNTVHVKTHMEVKRLASGLSNITLIEQVSFEEIERYFADARIHLNTSAFEGFPNTFLQAAKYGVPTVSMVVDPDGMLSGHSCGLVCGSDLHQCEANLRRLMSDDKVYAEMSQKSLQYVRKYHDKDLVVQKYEQALEAVLFNGRLE